MRQAMAMSGCNVLQMVKNGGETFRGIVGGRQSH